MDLGLSNSIAGLVFSSRLSHAALLTQVSANFSWPPGTLGDGISIPRHNEHTPEAPTDMVLCVCTFIYMAHHLRVYLPAFESLPR